MSRHNISMTDAICTLYRQPANNNAGLINHNNSKYWWHPHHEPSAIFELLFGILVIYGMPLISWGWVIMALLMGVTAIMLLVLIVFAVLVSFLPLMMWLA